LTVLGQIHPDQSCDTSRHAEPRIGLARTPRSVPLALTAVCTRCPFAHLPVRIRFVSGFMTTRTSLRLIEARLVCKVLSLHASRFGQESASAEAPNQFHTFFISEAELSYVKVCRYPGSTTGAGSGRVWVARLEVEE
jgi:hypothetical protein